MPRLFFGENINAAATLARAIVEWSRESVKPGKIARTNTPRPPSQALPLATANRPVACGESGMDLSTGCP
mgnify:CR=1 FL=1